MLPLPLFLSASSAHTRLVLHLIHTCNATRGLATAAAKPSTDASRGKDRSRQLPALTRYGRDLTEEARRGLLDPVIGRQDVIQRSMQVLLRRTKHNPLLIGEAGVGKTAIVEGIAQLMAAPRPPQGLAGKRLVALDVGAVVAGSTYRGEFEERLQSLLHDCETAQGSVVLFIDEIHVLVGAGNVEGGLDFANMLKPALARSQLQVIGATTLDEYRQHIETDPALSRRFQPILVEEPSPIECLELLQGLAPRYEMFHGVQLPHDTLATAVAAAQRYIPERRLPDSAIDLLDEAAAKVRLAAAYTGSSGSSSSGSRGGNSQSSSSSRSSAVTQDDTSSAASRWAEQQQFLQQQQQQQQQIQQQQHQAGHLHQGSDLAARQASFLDEWTQSIPMQESPQQAHASSSTTPQSGVTVADQGTNTPKQQQQQQQRQQSGSPSQLGAAAGQLGGERSSSSNNSSSSSSSSGSGSSRGSAQSWSDWITAKGWRGEAEVHRQHLLEWFGASPHHPLKGSAGHRQTTTERRKKHEQLFGDGTRPDFTGSPTAAAAAAAGARPTAVAAAAGSSSGSQSPSKAASASSPHTQQAPAAAAVPSLSTMGALDYTAKPCPHCGTVVLPAYCPDPVRLQCGHCGFRFLNVAPEKLQLGTTVLLDRQQEPPYTVTARELHQQQQQQQAHEQQQQQWGLDQQPPHHLSLSQMPADVAATAVVGGATVSSQAGPPLKRTAVAVQQRPWDINSSSSSSVRDPSQQQAPTQQQQQLFAAEPAHAGIAEAGPTAAAAAAASGGTTTSSSFQRPSSSVSSGGSSTSSSSSALRGGGRPLEPAVTPADILQVVSEATGIPQHLLTGLPAAATAATGLGAAAAGTAALAAVQEVSTIQSALLAAVKGQQEAVAAIIGALRLCRMGLAPQQHTQLPQQQQQQQVLPASAGSARPALSLLFQGPSGTGKSTAAKVLAEALLPGEPQGVLVFSCGELSERHSISRLVGAPPGYVGYGKGGLLTEALRRRPHSVVLFDDVERAHPDVVGLLLQAAEDGYLMDSMGHTINLRSAVLLFTANTNRPAVEPAAAAAATWNAAAAGRPSVHGAAAGGAPVGAGAIPTQALEGRASFSTAVWQQQQLHSNTNSSSGITTSSRSFFTIGGSGSEGAELEPDTAGHGTDTPATSSSSDSRGGGSSSGPGSARDAMMLELGSRVDEVVMFKPLNSSSMTEVVQQQLQQAAEQALQQGVLLQVSPQASAWLAAAGCSAAQGARPLTQLIRRHVLVPLAAAVMDCAINKPGAVAEAGAGRQDGVWAVATFGFLEDKAQGAARHHASVPQLQLQKL